MQFDWIAVDWGTSNVRAWGLTDANEVKFFRESDQGMSKLKPEQYPETLRKLMGEHFPKTGSEFDVIICGMAGAKQGWLEAPYLETPAHLGELGQRAVEPEMPYPGLRPKIVSGVCQRTSDAQDVMRGEETQLLGLLEIKPDFSGVACLPGTHSKWARIENGTLSAFSTAMTGELFDVLSTHSVLRHSMPKEQTNGDTQGGLAQGLAEGMQAPHLLTSKLFKTRAASLLSGRDPDWCAGYLSGLLVGSEVAGYKDWLTDAPVPLIGSERLCQLYAKALAMIGAKTEIIASSDATLAGLGAVRKQIKHD